MTINLNIPKFETEHDIPITEIPEAVEWYTETNSNIFKKDYGEGYAKKSLSSFISLVQNFEGYSLYTHQYHQSEWNQLYTILTFCKNEDDDHRTFYIFHNGYTVEMTQTQLGHTCKYDSRLQLKERRMKQAKLNWIEKEKLNNNPRPQTLLTEDERLAKLDDYPVKVFITEEEKDDTKN